MVMEPKVSVVVPAYNAQSTIAECIDSLLKLEYPKDAVEFIFVDDGSSDSTRDIIARYPKVKLLKQSHGGPAQARNLGWRSSNGEVIVFTDSDCIVPQDWVRSIVKELDNVDVVGGSLKPAFKGSAPERFEQMRRDRLYGNKRGFASHLPSCNLAIKRSVLEEAGGFDEDYKYASAEDYDLCRRIRDTGHKILYEPLISIVHKHVTAERDLLRKAHTHGREIMLFREKMKSPLLKESAKLLAKAAVLPLMVLYRYPLGLMALGFKYEANAVLGQVDGLRKYYLGRNK
jgi:glycosyltransferase involved in cell wall biosynthesis